MQNVKGLAEELGLKPDFSKILSVGAAAATTVSEATFIALVKKKAKYSRADLKKRVQFAWDNVAKYSALFEADIRPLLHPTLVAESFTLVSAV